MHVVLHTSTLCGTRCVLCTHYTHTCTVPTHRDQLVPKQLDALSDKRIVTIAGGWRHSMAADSEGRVYAWGWNKVCVAN